MANFPNDVLWCFGIWGEKITRFLCELIPSQVYNLSFWQTCFARVLISLHATWMRSSSRLTARQTNIVWAFCLAVPSLNAFSTCHYKKVDKNNLCDQDSHLLQKFNISLLKNHSYAYTLHSGDITLSSLICLKPYNKVNKTFQWPQYKHQSHMSIMLQLTFPSLIQK